MILKASQRGGGQDLAVHLLRTDENEHVLVHELRGFASDDLKGAFKEAEAISRGTKCVQYLFSLSLSPPESELASVSAFEGAIERAEKKLGLEGQPRAIVFHEKEGRRHAHCVWSRIDAETMTAKQMSFYKGKLTDLSRDLYLDHGWSMPKGLAHPGGRDPTNFTLAEWQQAKRLGQDPRWLKSVVQDCWKASDNGRSFGSALEERGLFLARGDKRGFVITGHDGEVHSLPRVLGLKTKEVRGRLGSADDLRSLSSAQEIIGQRMGPALRRHVAESRDAFRERSAKLGEYKEALTKQHRTEREGLAARHQSSWHAETKARADRLPTGFRSLWARLTGTYQKTRSQNEREAAQSRECQDKERQALIDAQLEQRARLQLLFKDLRKRQAEQLLELRKEVGRFFKFSRGHDQAQTQRREMSIGLKLER